ncbi:MAG: prepilin peptidase [Saccharofermentanales bacterium]
MNIFSLAISNIAFLLLASSGSIGLYLLYNRMPPAWFMEHPGSREPEGEALENRPIYRMKKFPDSVLFCFSVVLLSFVFFIQYGYSLLLVCNLVPLVFFALIFVADVKTGIIPDQFVAGLVFSSLFWIAYDISILLAESQPLYYSITGRLPAALFGGAAIFLIGRIGGFILKQEAMGMGDVKLMFACGLIVDFAGIFWVMALSFLLAFVPALFGIINKNRPKAGTGIFGSGRLPFAPFIVGAAAIYMIFPAEFAFVAAWYGGL